jgi:putative ABC transport system ATP-binding protein
MNLNSRDGTCLLLHNYYSFYVSFFFSRATLVKKEIISMNHAIINISHISKIYTTESLKTVALDNISFEVQKGEFVALMGPSGSGKSTLMNILGALDIPTSGTYLLDGKNVGDLSDDALAEIRNKKIGFVFQAFNLLPRVTVLENVMLPMHYAGIPVEERMKIATKYLKMVDLANRIAYFPNQLSGGQQQRAAIARALCMNPRLILADEPTGNIASTQAEEIMQIFHKINKQGHTILMITHEQDIAAHAQRTITIRDGKLVSDKHNAKPLLLSSI